eukprot:Rmarinus@m.3180
MTMITTTRIAATTYAIAAATNALVATTKRTNMTTASAAVTTTASTAMTTTAIAITTISITIVVVTTIPATVGGNSAGTPITMTHEITMDADSLTVVAVAVAGILTPTHTLHLEVHAGRCEARCLGKGTGRPAGTTTSITGI